MHRICWYRKVPDRTPCGLRTANMNRSWEMEDGGAECRIPKIISSMKIAIRERGRLEDGMSHGGGQMEDVIVECFLKMEGVPLFIK